MPNTYTQIHIQAVFPVKYRRCQIHPDWRHDLYKYITGIVQNRGHKMLAINGMSDHLHLLFGMRPTQSLSDLMQEIKQASSKWINDRNLTLQKFEWQQGFGAFSYRKKDVSHLVQYIRDQELHHSGVSFLVEYHSLLEEFGVEYDERYVFSELI